MASLSENSFHPTLNATECQYVQRDSLENIAVVLMMQIETRRLEMMYLYCYR